MSFPFPLTIDLPGVSLAQTLHNSRKGGIGYLDGQMDMVGHQTKSMNAVAKLFVSLLKETMKIFLVLFFKEVILPGIPPEHDMVCGPKVEKAWFPCHGVS